jgi:hypothetical protein
VGMHWVKFDIPVPNGASSIKQLVYQAQNTYEIVILRLTISDTGNTYMGHYQNPSVSNYSIWLTQII